MVDEPEVELEVVWEVDDNELSVEDSEVEVGVEVLVEVEEVEVVVPDVDLGVCEEVDNRSR